MKSGIPHPVLLTVLLAAILFLVPVCSIGQTIDRVIAFTGDEAITERELVRQHERDRDIYPDRTVRETLEAMINTTLMLQDARRLHLWARNESELLNKYLDLKIKASVFVNDKEIAEHYKANRKSYGGRGLAEVKEEIRTYLDELNFNKKLKEHVEGLRASANIVILDLPLSD